MNALQLKSSEFMLQLHKQLTDEKKVAETTANAYIRTLYILNDKKPFKNLSFLRTTDKIVAQIEKDYAESTQKTLYSALTSVLSLYKDKGTYKKVYQFYYDKMMAKAQDASKTDTADKTDKQEENWLSWNEVEKTANELRQKALNYAKDKNWDALLHSLVLGLYVWTAPRRNQDYLSMKIVRLGKKDKEDDLSKEHNWLVLMPKDCPTKFIFNKYKTSKTYGQQTLDLTQINTSEKPLFDTILMYVRNHPSLKDKKVKEAPFLVDDKGTEIVSQNAITRILNKVFGKNIGSSMLRHIYLSDKYDITEMKEDALKMAHSVSQQKEYLKAEEASSPEPSSPPSNAQTPPQTEEAHTALTDSPTEQHQETPSPTQKSHSKPRNKTPRKAVKSAKVYPASPSCMPPAPPQ